MLSFIISSQKGWAELAERNWIILKKKMSWAELNEFQKKQILVTWKKAWAQLAELILVLQKFS